MKNTYSSKKDMLKYKLMEKQLSEIDLKDEYARRVDQKLNKKLGFVKQNFNIIDTTENNEEEEENDSLPKNTQMQNAPRIPYRSSNEKQVRYSKTIENNEQHNELDSDYEENGQKNLETELYDDYKNELDSNKKSDFLRMAVHYKNLCRNYKRQLVESQKTIRDLHTKIEKQEHRNWIHKRQRSSLKLAVSEYEENMKQTFGKCASYCEKINRLNDVVTTYSDKDKDDQEEIIFNTLKNVVREKKEIKIFAKSYTNLICCINPNLADHFKIDNINFTNLNSINAEALKYLQTNSLKGFHCKCKLSFNGNSDQYHSNSSLGSSNSVTKKENALSICQFSDSTTTSSSSLDSNTQVPEVDQKRHGKNRPTVEYLVRCVNLIQELFDVDCFHGIPTALNDVYYKLGQLNNFKKNIQNIFAPNKNYSLERLVNAVQITHNQLNDQLGKNLKSILHASNLHSVIDKFNMYDEYFPIFRELLDQIMKLLEISRLDQIIPSIKALKILATPTGAP